MKKLLMIALQIGWLLLLPRRVLAHGGGALPEDLWSHWNLDALLLIGLVLPALLYGRGAMGYRVAWWRTAAFVSGLLALWIALISPLEALSASLFSAHMVQHLLLMLVAAPLLVWSRPFAPILRGLPSRWGKGVGKVAYHKTLHSVSAKVIAVISGAVAGSVMVLVLHVLALWLWHIPILYNGALANEFVHALGHASFFITAALFWWMIFKSEMAGGRVLAVFAVMMASGLLGALMTFATVPWYAHNALLVGAWGMTPLEDQQVAGLTMWIPAGILYAGVAAALLGRWLYSLEARMLKRERLLSKGTHNGLHKGLSDA